MLFVPVSFLMCWLLTTSKNTTMTMKARHEYGRRLQKALEGANISKLLFLRHGQTAPAPVDFDRLLTDKGRDQSKRSGELFGKRLRPYFFPALVSPAPRTVETAEIFLRASHEWDADETDACDWSLLHADALYDGTMQPKGSALFRKLGYAPLREYLEHPDESTRKDASIVLGSYADNALVSITEAVEDRIRNTFSADNNRSDDCGNDGGDCDDDSVPALIDDDDSSLSLTQTQSQTQSQSQSRSRSRSQTLLVVAHAIYLPSAALGVATLLGCGDSEAGIEPILSRNTKEAEGYLIDAEHRTVRYLSRTDRD